MEGITPPRPLSHDLIVAIIRAFGVALTEVFIYKFDDGIFYSELHLEDGERQIVLDARTSDAIAIAMRTKTPIYTTAEILENTGIQIEITADDNYNISKLNDEQEPLFPKLENYTIEELERSLTRMIELEKYEEAAQITKILNAKKNNNSEK
jgi:bifunctional DNase/RNase